VIGIGSDLVEVDRFRTVVERTPGIVDRVFREGEREYARGRADPAEALAVRFAAKEAVMKALGLGLGGVAMRDIEVVRDGSGAPAVVLHGTAAATAAARGVSRWLLTLSHTKSMAQAVAVAL
jgi:holo-[acyl-carrier protein] synthase